MNKEKSVEHTFLHFSSRHKLKFQHSKRFSSNVALRRVSKSYVRRLIRRIHPEGASTHWLAEAGGDVFECLYLRKEPAPQGELQPSFFDTHLSQTRSPIPDELAACVVAFDLAQPLFFISDFMVGYRTTEKGKRLHNYAGLSFGTSNSMWMAVYEQEGNFLTEDVWNEAKRIQRGIQSISRQSHPRLHQALRFHARAIGEDFFDYCYLNEYLVLESLFNTSSQEITHKMAERAAIVAGGSERVGIYREIKRLSVFRNQVAHGFRKDKSTQREASKGLQRLSAINRRLLRSILSEPALLAVWKTKSDEDLENRLLSLTMEE